VSDGQMTLSTDLSTCCRRSLFFFSSRRRHTRSKRDWSSDVCSSDLRQRGLLVGAANVLHGIVQLIGQLQPLDGGHGVILFAVLRSEERRVGKECRWWWWASDKQQNGKEGWRRATTKRMEYE